MGGGRGAGCGGLLAQRADPGMLGRETMPVLARLLVRQGADEAAQVLAAADRAAREADVLEWLVPTGRPTSSTPG